VQLVLTPGTVANHMEAILRRLDLGSRTQVGIWAVERGLFRSDSDDDRQRRTIVTSAIHL
jgi:hypothetical protein